MDTTTANQGTIRLGSEEFESHEVPHYFLTSGRKWLVCIDGSSQSKLALYHALDLMSPEDNLLLVHAAKKARSLMPQFRSTSEAQQEPAPEPDSVRRGKGYLAHASSLVKQWGEDVKYQTRLLTAKDPREAICDLASEEKVDYIVMGSRGMNPLKQMFMGSVSTYVSAHACCPVFVIRETEEQKRQKKQASVEEKKEKKRLSAERKAEKKKMQKETTAPEEPKLAEPPIVPPVTEVESTGPIVPSETTIPVMEK